MKRREFLATSLAASAVAFTSQPQAQAQTPAASPREYYQLRKYHLQSGPQTKLTDNYIGDALIPALSRLGIGPVGAFHLEFGPETPTLYVLLPSANLETLATVDLRLAKDEEFMKAADPFWNAPAAAPPFIRMESWLYIAFEGYPKLTAPTVTAQHGKRIFQLRTYESPTNRDHQRKVEMMNHGEYEMFHRSGCGQVFYGDALVGSHSPSLTYMLTFPDMDALAKGWEAFFSDPQWKKLQASPRYGFEPTVSNVSNLILTPAPYSQI